MMRVLVLALVACSRAPAGTPGEPPSAPARTADASVRIADAQAAPDASQKGSKKMSADEAFLNTHFDDKGWGKPVEIVAYDGIPGFYRVDFASRGEHALLQGGKLVTAKGLAAAEAYIRDVKLVSHKPKVGDVIELLIFFEALPPIKKPAPDQYYDMPEHAELNPRLEPSGKLTLNYLLPRVGNAVANPKIVDIERWSVVLGGKLAWKSEALKFDLSK
jgi:hypothetical protein